MKKLFAAASVVTTSALLSVGAQAAPLLKIDAGAGMWMQDFSGELLDETINLKDDLGISGTSNFYFYANVDHPIFILPDFKIRHQGLVAEGDEGSIPASIAAGDEFAGIDLSGITVDVDTTMDLTYTDFVLNYGLPLPMVDLDFGLNTRFISGTFALKNSDAGVDESGTFSLPLPMGHVAAEFEIPGANVRVGGELNILPLDGASVTDYSIRARYFFPLPTNMLMKLGVEAGYHAFSMEVGDEVLGTDTADLSSSVSASGIYAGATLRF